MTRPSTGLDYSSVTTSTARYNALDATFHVELAKMSGNDLVAERMAALRTTLSRAMESAFEQLDDAENRHAPAHDGACRDRRRHRAPDADEAARLVSAHITGVDHRANVNAFL